MASVTKDLIDAINAMFKRKTSEYDATAVVKRIEGNRAWVHINGGVDETPVDTMTINARVGDTVRVHVGGGKAWIIGNATAPPTDDRKADVALKRTENVSDEVLELDEHIASSDRKIEAVTKIAGDTNQYFWHTQEGTDTGAHITEKPQDEFLDDPTNGGGNLLARSNGIAVRDGLTELAQFSAEGERFQNENGFSMLEVGRKESGLYIYDVQWFDYHGEGEFVMEWDVHYVTSILGYDKYDALVYTVLQAEYSYDDNVITLTTSGKTNLIAAGTAFVKVTYTASGRFPYFTFGNRKSYKGSEVGNYSTVIGENCVAKGATSLATGESTNATGMNSTAFGQDTRASAGNSTAFGKGTKTSASEQFAVGKYNEPNSDDLFEVGKGAGESNRSNAFVVDKYGGVAIGNPSMTFAESTHTVVNDEAIAAGDYKNGTTNISKSGYYPIAISGWRGSSRYLSCNRAYLTNQANGSAVLNWLVFNGTSASHTATMDIRVLWIRVA